jgi:hypothetical protein
MLRKGRVKFFAVGLLALALAGANSVCLNCHTPDVALHVPLNGNAAGVGCDFHQDCEASECPDSHCGDYLSAEGFAPRRADVDSGACVFLSDAAPAVEAAQPVVSRLLVEGLRLRRWPPSLFQSGLIPRLI